MNFLDYLDWRGDIKFEERQLNEVDNLIFSTLAYTDMEGLIGENGTTISELYMVINPKLLLEKAAQSERYKNVLVKYYINKIDTERNLQFSAVTFEANKKISYIAYRGTDNTLAGWHEDCNMSYLPKTPGQFEAAEYLNRISEKSEHDLIIGGHSKGGNFAVYAAAFCKNNIQERILKVYSNDGPGFNSTIANSKEYLDIIPKTEHIITDSSIVGILLSSKSKRKVIKSSAMGFDQHNPYTWNVLSEEERRAVDQELTHGERIESCVLLDEYIVFPSSEGLTILRYKDIAWVFDYRKYRRRSLGFMRTIYFVDEVMIFDGGGYEHTALSLENGDVKHMMIRLLDRMSYLNLYPLIGYDDKLYSEVKKDVNVLRDAYWNNQKNR